MTFNEGVLHGTFDENSPPGSDTLRLVRLAPDPGNPGNFVVAETIEIPVTSTTISGPNVIITPDNPLLPLTQYYLEIPAGAYQDAAGNAFAGATGATAWNFTTAPPDNDPPYDVFLNPIDNDEGVSPTANLVIEFDDLIKKGSGSILIRRSSDNALIETIAIDSAAVTVDGATVTINPTTVLPASTTYHVLIDLGAILDLANNPYAGITDSSAWSFTTTSLTAGAIAFTGFNADGTSDLAFVALTDIRGGESIVFTDKEWNGSPVGVGGAFQGVGTEMVWTAPAGGINAGTIVTLSDIGSAPAANVGNLLGGLQLESVDESVYAVAGSTQSPLFLAFLSNNSVDKVTGTGLTLGTTAVRVTTNADIAAYVGPRKQWPTFSGYLAFIGNAENWLSQETLFVDDAHDGNAPDLPFDTTSFAVRGATSDYSSWSTDTFGAAAGGPGTAATEDFDHDGVPNQDEYLFGLDATSGASTAAVGEVTRAPNSFAFSYTRRHPDLTGKTYQVKYSPSMAPNSWTLDYWAQQEVIAITGTIQTIRVTLSPGLLSEPQLFVRVIAN